MSLQMFVTERVRALLLKCAPARMDILESSVNYLCVLIFSAMIQLLYAVEEETAAHQTHASVILNMQALNVKHHTVLVFSVTILQTSVVHMDRVSLQICATVRPLSTVHNVRCTNAVEFSKMTHPFVVVMGIVPLLNSVPVPRGTTEHPVKWPSATASLAMTQVECARHMVIAPFSILANVIRNGSETLVRSLHASTLRQITPQYAQATDHVWILINVSARIILVVLHVTNAPQCGMAPIAPHRSVLVVFRGM
mmetsp:Transcript_2564/g.9763  ORF Transcript_2564/g.9763 Transcript_2564/m.9763 type:complete len:253 (-) Transcript_2564:6712-7470(-)